MKQLWWKILSVLIIIYSIIMGLITPLNSGIMEVKPGSLQTGLSYTLDIDTYNTSYKEGAKIDAWIKIDSIYAIAAQSVTAVNNNHIQAKFLIPINLPTETKSTSYPIILNDTENGAFVRPSAVNISQSSIDYNLAKNNWTHRAINVDALTIKSQKAFPFRPLIYETIRNTFYHVPLWFAMTFLFFFSAICSSIFLYNGDPFQEILSVSFIKAGVVFGILGCITGSIWAKYTWGTWWTLAEVKLNVSAIAMLIYLAYFVLRGSFEDEEIRSKVSSVYSIFAFVAAVMLLFVVPRMVEGSLHPGNGGNPGFGGEDLDHTMKRVFYPAIIGWLLFGIWLSTLSYRIDSIRHRLMDDDD